MSLALGVALIVLLTAATGYFVAQEFAYVAVDRNTLRQMAQEGDVPAERALRVTSKLSFALSAAQFGITVTALLVGYISEPLVGVGLAELLDPSMSYTTRLSLSVAAVLIFSTVLQMVFGELAPKNLAIARTVAVARALSRSTLLYLKLSGPIVRLFDRAATYLLRKVGIEPVEELPHGATAEDLTRIIDESHTDGLLDDDLSDVLEGGLRFRQLDAGDVMTPRVRVTTIRADEPVERIVRLLDTGWSRFPVTGSDGDDIVGVAGIAELLAVPFQERGTVTIGSVVAPPTVVPPRAPLPRVLEQLRADHRQMAVVVDEHGGFAGVVTFEDIAEEVVGEILDEDDLPEPTIAQDGRDAWLVPGRVRLDEFAVATGIRLDADDDYSTISGLILQSLGRTARVQDVLDRAGQLETGAGHHPIESRSDAQRAAGKAPDGEEPERQLPITARLTVTEVDRHVPAIVHISLLTQQADDLGVSEEPQHADGGDHREHLARERGGKQSQSEANR